MNKLYSHLAVILCALINFESAFADPTNSELAKQVQNLAQSVSALTQKLSAQNERIAALESENKRLLSVAGSKQAQSALPTQQLNTSSGSSGTKPYLPDIGVVVDIVANSTQSKEDEEGNDRVSARELELVFGHDVDPYTRLDATIAFSDFEDAALEEAYASYSGLPGDLNARIGKYRPKFGKINSLHRDSLETVDQALVVQRYLGAEGMSKAGLELSTFSPLSGDAFTQQIILGFIEGGVGEDGELLGETRRAPSYYTRLGNFFDLNEAHTLELGASYLTGSSNQDSDLEVAALGADLTWSYRLNSLQRIKWQSEAIFQNRDQVLLEDSDGNSLRDNSNPWGFYSLLDFRFSERFGLGARYDWVEPVSLELDSEHQFDSAITPYLTFYQSEFARWRLQYQNISLAEGEDDDRVFLQGTFAIGTHKHSIQ